MPINVPMPKISNAGIADTPNGLFVVFEEAGKDVLPGYLDLWVKALGPNGYGYTCTIGSGDERYSIPNTDLVVRDGDMVHFEFYYEAYPVDDNDDPAEGWGTRGPIHREVIHFERDWYGLSYWQHDFRMQYEETTIDQKIVECRKYKILTEKEVYESHSKEAALDNTTGVWMQIKRNGSPDDYLGISPRNSQHADPQKWLMASIGKIFDQLEEDRGMNRMDPHPGV